MHAMFVLGGLRVIWVGKGQAVPVQREFTGLCYFQVL